MIASALPTARAARGLLAASSLSLIMTVAGGAPPTAIRPLPGGYMHAVPLANGFIVVVTTIEARCVDPAQPLHSQLVLKSHDDRRKLFSAPLTSDGRWWVLQAVSTAKAGAVWNNELVGPFDIDCAPAASSHKPTPKAKTPRTLTQGGSAFDGDLIAMDPDGRAWVAAYVPADRGSKTAVRRFDAHGVADDRFAANAEKSVGAKAGVSEIVAGSSGSWWFSGEEGPGATPIDYIAKLRDDGTLDRGFGHAGLIRFEMPAGIGHEREPTAPHVLDLFDDMQGTLWITGSGPVPEGAVSAGPDLWLQGLSSADGRTKPQSQPSGCLLDDMGIGGNGARTLDWARFATGRSMPTLCIGTSPAGNSAARELRCMERAGVDWVPLGTALALGAGQLREVVAMPGHGRRFLVGVDEATSAALLVWQP